MEEQHFSELFNGVLEIILLLPEFNVRAELVTNAIYNIRQRFTTFTYMETDFSQPENLIGYFYAYSTLNSALARDRFLTAFHNCLPLTSYVNNNNTLNIISLGGGPGTDLIGFSSVLNQFLPEHGKHLNLHLMDYVPHWSIFHREMTSFIRNRQCGNVSELFRRNIVESRFMQGDLNANFAETEEYITYLMNADIVLLSRVLNILRFSESTFVLRGIADRMKRGAFLLIIDTREDYRNVNNLEVLYETGVMDYELRPAQRERFNTSPSTRSSSYIVVCRKI